MGSSSWRSRATHANGRGSVSAHRASSVVLPYPAGAITVANGSRDARNPAITSILATVPGLVRGAASFTSARSKGASATVIAGPIPEDLVTNSRMSSGSMRATGSRPLRGYGAGTAAGLTAGPVPVTVSGLPGLLTQLTASW